MIQLGIRFHDTKELPFEERLKVLLREIKNLAVNKGTIEVCSDTDNCKFCDFNKYCRRVKSDD